jgi:SAM-dependent methyltransferase
VTLPPTQYATDANLAARQRLWRESEQTPALDFHGWVLGVAGIRPGDAVAEMGCGNGDYLARLPNAIGVDSSMGMLASARARVVNALVRGDMQALPFATDAFDVVLAPHVLYHVPDRQAAACELRRVVRPDGRCIAVTNSAANHRELIDLVEHVVGNGWRYRRPSETAFSMENGEAQLRAGFESVERVDAPTRTFLVTDADALADYVASVGDGYESQVREWTTWPDVVAGCRAEAAAVIARDGAFPIASVFGAFVCA